MHDTAQLPTTIPARLTAGDTWRWRSCFPSHPPSEGWSLSYVLRGPEGKVVTATGEADGDDAWIVTVVASVTEECPAGTYAWSARVAKDGQRFTVAQGLVVVDPDPESDQLTALEERLAQIDEALREHRDAWIRSESINGRSREYAPPVELTQERARVAYLVEIERRRGRMPELGRLL